MLATVSTVRTQHIRTRSALSLNLGPIILTVYPSNAACKRSAQRFTRRLYPTLDLECLLTRQGLSLTRDKISYLRFHTFHSFHTVHMLAKHETLLQQFHWKL